MPSFWKKTAAYATRNRKHCQTRLPGRSGAGDTFCGSALGFVLKYGLDGLDADKLAETLEFANAAASVITTRKGALAVMPSLSEVEEYLRIRKQG